MELEREKMLLRISIDPPVHSVALYLKNTPTHFSTGLNICQFKPYIFKKILFIWLQYF